MFADLTSYVIHGTIIRFHFGTYFGFDHYLDGAEVTQPP